MVILVIGPTASGKTTYVKEYMDQANKVVTYTSRKPRDGELEGIDYYFRTREHIKEKYANGELFDMVEYGGNLYGSSLKEVKEKESQGRAYIVIEPDGAERYIKVFEEEQVAYELVSVTAPEEELLKRLEVRRLADSIKYGQKEATRLYMQRQKQLTIDLIKVNKFFKKHTNYKEVKAW